MDNQDLFTASNYFANIKEMCSMMLDRTDDRRILADEMHYMPTNGFRWFCTNLFLGN